MRVPFEWLREYVTIRLRPEALAHRLTMAGLEVTGIERVEGQPVFHLEITPNRADCLSIIGVAREVAAMTGQRLKPPPVRSVKREVRSRLRTSNFELRTHLAIRIEDRAGCARYLGRLMERIRVGPSPSWMQRRLGACGIRAINNVVDITNYVLLEYGQPLHAFDFDRVAGGTILVRRARPNESITTLDGVARALSSEMLVIAEVTRAIAVAGVMGGVGSEVTDRTTSILLESALFDPLTVRRTARALGLTSESSYRFERGVDPGGVATASARAADLLEQLAGGRERTVQDVGARPSKRTIITLDPQRANRWLGTALSPTTMRSLLVRLSCRVAASGTGAVQRVEVPSFRRDLRQDVDLYEELARAVGYEQLPRSLPRAPLVAARPGPTLTYHRMQSLRCLCASLGLTEVVTWALVSESDLTRLGYPQGQAARLSNPLSQDHAYLRPTLLIGALAAIRRNLTQGASGVRLFEAGQVFVPGPAGRYVETPRLLIALAGWWSRDWRAKEPVDFFRLKGILVALLSKLCAGTPQIVTTQLSWAEPNRATQIMVNGRSVGVAGQVAAAMARELDLEQDIWVAELFVEGLAACARSTTGVIVPPALPPVKRDLSVLLGDETSCELVSQTIRMVGGSLASRVELIDRYTGAQVPQGRHSLTFSIEYRDPSRTLTAAEVDALHHEVGQALIQRFDAQLR